MKSFSTATMVLFLWLLTALAIDRLVLAVYCPVCANLLAFDLKLHLPAAELAFPPVSLLVLLVLPMILLALYLLPWRTLLSRTAWSEAFALWCQPWFWLLAAVALTVLGESLFIVLKGYLPGALVVLMEKFSLSTSLSVAVPGYKETTPFTLTASLPGLLGLALGIYLFLRKGLRAALNRG
ncbi:MAG: hypothetical protein JSR19_02155 [Proteobacteria bacterium]|nr:hypothetical protein [Pseudomonadota bacterium]HQR03600.1 hypothetical protein [Rhodocyclaceae bacterium]